MYEVMVLEKPFYELDTQQRWQAQAKALKPNLPKEVEMRFKDLIPLWHECLSVNPAYRPSAKNLMVLFSEQM